MTQKKISRKELARRRRKRVIRNRIILLAVLLAVIVLVIVVISRCSRQNGESQVAGNNNTNQEMPVPEGTTAEQASGTAAEIPSQPEKKETHTPEEYAAAGVNELKDVPILMYHRIYDMKNSETQYTGGNVDENGYNRTAEAFEADLEYYYENGYRMIRLDDFLNGYIDVPFGMSPIILTFDDGAENAVLQEFDADGNPVFAKNCAVDVLERVKKKHPDFNVTATFFLNGGLFNNGLENDTKVVNWMVDNGYDIGNHTWSHPDLSTLSAAEIEEEVGSVYSRLEDVMPGRYVNIVALPFGIPSNEVLNSEEKYEALYSGTYKGSTYTTKATLLCGWTVNSSPFSNEYTTRSLRRIRGYDNNGEDFDITFNFNLLNSGRKYISDGDPETIVIREDDRSLLGDEFGRNVITY